MQTIYDNLMLLTYVKNMISNGRITGPPVKRHLSVVDLALEYSITIRTTFSVSTPVFRSSRHSFQGQEGARFWSAKLPWTHNRLGERAAVAPLSRQQTKEMVLGVAQV